MWRTALALVLGSVGCSASMTCDGAVTVTHVAVTDDGSRLLLTVTVHNGHIRDVSTYDRLRGMRYDEAQKKLTVDWKEQPCTEASLLCSHYVYPTYTRIPAGTSIV